MKTFSTNHSHDDDNDIGCNFTHGGEGTAGCHLSIETRARMSASFKGKAKSDTHKAKLSAAVKATFDAHPLSDETKMKMSLSHRGKRMSDVTRSKMSLASKGRSPGNKGCKRVVINGEIKYEQKQES